MKVTISCAGRFHSYYMADQFNQRNVLDQLITSYPRYEVLKYGIPGEKLTSLLMWEVTYRSWSKFARLTHLNDNYGIPMLNEFYDRLAVRHLNPNTDVFIGWSSKSERSLAKAKANGALAIVERNSSHIEVQTEILKEEFERIGKTRYRMFTHPAVIEKELREYEMADFISVPSSFAKRSFMEKGFPEAKIFQNAYGVNLTSFVPAPKHDDVFRVVYVGQMSLRKGVHYLLQAFEVLKLKNAELWLIGAMTPDLQSMIAKAGPNVKYHGIKSQAELKQLYPQGSVFALCSLEEGMAHVQTQAMACGLPLICTTNTGGEDLIHDGVEGFVIPIRNVEAIKEKIEWMYLHQEEAKEMGKRARANVGKGFTWSDFADRYVAFLKDHLPSRAAPATITNKVKA